MAELLIKATDYVHDDPEIDRQGAYKKGYPVVAFEDGHSWGAGESLPTFVILKVPGVAASAVQNWINSWQDDFDYATLATRPAQGEFDVKIFEKNVSVTGKNAITREKVESFLLSWGCSGITIAINVVNFTFGLWAAVRSEGFWGIPLILTKANFTLNSYNSTTGIGTIAVKIIDANIKTESVVGVILNRGGTILSSVHPDYIFTIERSNILTRFKAEVKLRAQRIYCRRRFYFTTSQVDQAIAAGGVMMITQAQAIAAIKDKLSE